MKLLNRKELVNFGFLRDMKFDVADLVEHSLKEGLLDFDQFNDIKVSSNSKMKEFVLANSFSKSNFFTENESSYLEGEKYKQKYLTEIIDKTKSKSAECAEKKDSIFFRQKRLQSDNLNYNPYTDELNYGKRNEFVKGPFEKILNAFESQVTRVRLAYLAPQFKIKPHVDYDPSYITRYHIPIITNPLCSVVVSRNRVEHRAHFPADGKVYFLNTGFKHWAQNDSLVGRLHLIVDTHGQNELQQQLVPIE